MQIFPTKEMYSLLVQRIFKCSQTPKYILRSTIFPIQKYFVSNVTTLEVAYQNAKAYCKGMFVQQFELSVITRLCLFQ